MSDKKTGVVLLNMGGPDSLEAVQQFLENLFADPAIISAPLGPLRKPLARFIAKKRAPSVIEKYRMIGGKSPLLEITRYQAAAVAEELGEGFSGHVCMRYHVPRADETVAELARYGVERVVLLSLYPHYCSATSGTSLDDANRALEKGLPDVERVIVDNWPDFGPYLDALTDCVREGIKESGADLILFSAHGLPQKLVDSGDPYLDQVKRTVAGVVDRLGGADYRLAFQSKVGPVKWLEPSVETMLEELAEEGKKSCLVVPVSFVSDHIETLHEIDVEYGELARELGIHNFSRTPSLNTRPRFIKALAELVRLALA